MFHFVGPTSEEEGAADEEDNEEVGTEGAPMAPARTTGGGRKRPGRGKSTTLWGSDGRKKVTGAAWRRKYTGRDKHDSESDLESDDSSEEYGAEGQLPYTITLEHLIQLL